MKVIDLTHTISPGMPVFPGTEPPMFEPANTLEKHGFIEKKLTMYSHTGTHIDAPSHVMEKGFTLDSFPTDRFIGQGWVLDAWSLGCKTIERKHLLPLENQVGEIDFLLLYTGWSRYWGRESYFQGFPVLSLDAASWLADNFNLKGVGADTISIDHEESKIFEVHKLLLKKQIFVLENLTNLEFLIGVNFMFLGLPLKTANADGAPIRAVAIIS